MQILGGMLQNMGIRKGEQCMKSTGIVRKVDELGRFVLPAELRQELGIEIKCPLEIYTENGRIILQKQQSSCIFCGSSEKVVSFGEKLICSDCVEKIKAI